MTDEEMIALAEAQARRLKSEAGSTTSNGFVSLQSMQNKTDLQAVTPKIQRVVKPKAGQVWAYGGINGRRETIHRVSRGAVGSWKYENGRFLPLGRATAMWVQWESKMLTITVSSLWKNWVPTTPTCTPDAPG